MSTSRSYQCLSCRLKTSTARRITQPLGHHRRRFHISAPAQARKRTFPSIKASSLEPTTIDTTKPEYRPYTAREKQLLALKYTPAQMKIIEAGEAAIDAEDMASQGRMRTDPMRIKYLDDFATMRPVLDRPLEAEDLEDARKRGGEEDTGRGQGLVQGRNFSKQKPTPPTPTTSSSSSSASTEQTDPHTLRLSQQTSLPPREISRLRIKNLVSHRVVNQTRMGKIQSLYYLTIAGNGDGMVGVGEGKAAEDEDGRRQAMMNAVRNMRPVARYEERTIYGSVRGKVGGTVVELDARPPGFGNRCQHLIFELARAAGISDLAARTPRSRNKMNVVKAAFQALTSQRVPEDVALGRGRKMVDARRVYYGGEVL